MILLGKLLIKMILPILLKGLLVPAEKSLQTLEQGQTGRIYLESTSPYDFKHILDGSGNDPKVVVFGDLVLPEGVKGKVPAMVFVHGSGGWMPKHERYLRELKKMGVATFRTDSFRPRDVLKTVGEQISVTEAMMISDAYHALKILSTHPRIDPKRIGIMGASKGGAVALFPAWEPLRKAAVEGDLKFALHLPLYPPCAMLKPLRFTGAPILILSGELDEWTPAGLCVELTKALKSAGYDAQITVYPDAYHSFDSERPLHRVDRAFNITKCRFEVQPDGTTIEKTSGLPLDNLESRKKALSVCATRGVLAGRNSPAEKKALEDMRDFVTQVFGLEPT
jgi:dienelactone hydrolase